MLQIAGVLTQLTQQFRRLARKLRELLNGQQAQRLWIHVGAILELLGNLLEAGEVIGNKLLVGQRTGRCHVAIGTGDKALAVGRRISGVTGRQRRYRNRYLRRGVQLAVRDRQLERQHLLLTDIRCNKAGFGLIGILQGDSTAVQLLPGEGDNILIGIAPAAEQRHLITAGDILRVTRIGSRRLIGGGITGLHRDNLLVAAAGALSIGDRQPESKLGSHLNRRCGETRLRDVGVCQRNAGLVTADGLLPKIRCDRAITVGAGGAIQGDIVTRGHRLILTGIGSWRNIATAATVAHRDGNNVVGRLITIVGSRQGKIENPVFIDLWRNKTGLIAISAGQFNTAVDRHAVAIALLPKQAHHAAIFVAGNPGKGDRRTFLSGDICPHLNRGQQVNRCTAVALGFRVAYFRLGGLCRLNIVGAANIGPTALLHVAHKLHRGLVIRREHLRVGKVELAGVIRRDGIGLEGHLDTVTAIAVHVQ